MADTDLKRAVWGFIWAIGISIALWACVGLFLLWVGTTAVQ